MQDQHALLTAKGIQCVYLGSAQTDKSLEKSVFNSQDPHRLIFVTPEWIFKEANLNRVKDAATSKIVTLIAVDEAHLICEWQSFRGNYRDLETIKEHFSTTPVMFLTATATPSMAEKLKCCLHDPCVLKGTINRPNIILDVQEFDKGHVSKDNRGDYSGFATKVSKIISKDSAIVYTDFIADIAPITQALAKVGITFAHYHGELDARAKLASYRQWSNGEVQVMVATKAFGMGINSGDVIHVIRNGVPPNINTWMQELGRAGRRGQAATATILYSESDVQNVLGWLRDHLQNRVIRDTILAEFDISWKLVYSKLAGKCIRKTMLEYYNEELTDAAKHCCGVCDGQGNRSYVICTSEAKNLVQAINALGSKGECKISEFLRGSNSSWLTDESKRNVSYGAGCHHSVQWWRSFIRQCHGLGIVDRKVAVQAVSKHQHAVCATIHNNATGNTLLSDSQAEEVLVPENSIPNPVAVVKRKSLSLIKSPGVQDSKAAVGKERVGKGSHALYTVRQLMTNVENCMGSNKRQRTISISGDAIINFVLQ
jgi:RecQ family ATP-dependent DNA helicase